MSAQNPTKPSLAKASALLRFDQGGISVGGGKSLPYYFDDSPEGEPENILLHIL